MTTFIVDSEGTATIVSYTIVARTELRFVVDNVGDVALVSFNTAQFIETDR